MPTPYAGNPATFPASYNIPSDGDPADAASVNAAFEALGDRTAWLKARVTASAFVLILADTYAPGGIFSHTWTLDYAPSENVSLFAYTSNVQANDVFQVWARMPIGNSGSAIRATTRIAYSYDSTTGFDGTWAEMGSSETDNITQTLGVTFEAEALMHGQLTIASSQTKVFFAVQAKGATTNITTFSGHHADALANHYRPVP